MLMETCSVTVVARAVHVDYVELPEVIIIVLFLHPLKLKILIVFISSMLSKAKFENEYVDEEDIVKLYSPI